MKGMQAIVQFACQLVIAICACCLEFGAQARRNIGGHGNAANPASGVKCKRHVVIARKLAEISAATETMFTDPGNLPAGILHADNGRNLCKAREGCRLKSPTAHREAETAKAHRG